MILVGSVARSRRFRTQLADATRSLRVGPAEDPATQMGPLIEPAAGKLLGALSELGEGEEWLVKPRKLDEGAGSGHPASAPACSPAPPSTSPSTSARSSAS
ncbi:hypothetical protein GCM10025866_13490 [Naasia aerilata]|uniref:Uncharacterized protein n=1 Tax=Naasia aerilata TaxID=1162966 RepID=A0ABN6XP80_9MICO|nr:hypothetical protein GCM10025866_13490 [Naasia aerilata]